MKTLSIGLLILNAFLGGLIIFMLVLDFSSSEMAETHEFQIDPRVQERLTKKKVAKEQRGTHEEEQVQSEFNLRRFVFFFLE